MIDEVCASPNHQFGVDAILERRETQILEPSGLGLIEGSKAMSASASPRQSPSASRSLSAPAPASPRSSARRASPRNF